jgi:predicted nicotinamide N-methyase
MAIDPVAFITQHTRLVPVPSIPEIRLYTAHQATGLWRLVEAYADDPPPPYWAFPWAGGLALARHVLDRPALVAGRRILDLGAGSGLVGIAAARAGAGAVTAADSDPFALAALPLNAKANDVTLSIAAGDMTGGPAPDVDLVLVGDLFYEAALAERVTRFLDRCLAAGLEVLVGDPHRAHLPAARLAAIADYAVPDVGEVEARAPRPSSVFAFR